MDFTPIDDFQDFNYKSIAFCINGCDKEQLRRKLNDDEVSHLRELDENTRYITIFNSDLHGFDKLDDVYTDTVSGTLVLAQLFYSDCNKRWEYSILNEAWPNPD